MYSMRNDRNRSRVDFQQYKRGNVVQTFKLLMCAVVRCERAKSYRAHSYFTQFYNREENARARTYDIIVQTSHLIHRLIHFVMQVLLLPIVAYIRTCARVFFQYCYNNQVSSILYRYINKYQCRPSLDTSIFYNGHNMCLLYSQ